MNAKRANIPALLLAALAMALGASVGCDRMDDQPRIEPYEASELFPDNRGWRRPPEHTVARGQLRLDDHLHRGRVENRPAESLPMPVTEELLKAGRIHFNSFCAPCHGFVGDGDGMVAQRGFPDPASLHSDRLRAAPVGHFFHVITNGLGRMPAYAGQISVEERWAIVAYVRALQLSQHAPLEMAPGEQQTQLLGERGTP